MCDMLYPAVSPLPEGRFLKNSAFPDLPSRQEHASDWPLLLLGFHGDKRSGFYPHDFKGVVLFLFGSKTPLVSPAFCGY